MTNSEHSTDDLHRAAGAMLATHFAKCLRAEVDGKPRPDPHDVLDDDVDTINSALTFVGGLLGTCDCPAHRKMLQRFMAAMADVIGQQGGEMQLFIKRLLDMHQPCGGHILVEGTDSGTLRMSAVIEMPEFDDDPNLAVKQAAQAVREIMASIVEPLTSAVMDKAGFSVDEIRRRGPAAFVDVEVLRG